MQLYTIQMAVSEALTALRALTPWPGDGVCPTLDQCAKTAKASYESWSRLVHHAGIATDSLSEADTLVDLLRRVPEFRCSQVFHEGAQLCLKCSLEWVTTTHPDCDRPLKRTYHYQVLGMSQLQVWDVAENLVDRSDGTGRHFTPMVLAWAFVLCSRWVEVLQGAGERASMNQSEKVNRENFWEVIVNKKWHATVVRDDVTFYAPWCLERRGALE